MFYVIADVTQFDALDLVPERGRDITRVGALILRAAQDQLPVEHPDYPGIGITIAQLSGPTSPHPTGRFSAQSHECGSKGP
jgi:proline racemase